MTLGQSASVDVSNPTDHCFFGINPGETVYQLIDVANFSVLIDAEQAMFNLSALVGFEKMQEQNQIEMTIYFGQGVGVLDYTRLVKGKTFLGRNLSFFSALLSFRDNKKCVVISFAFFHW